MTGGFLRYLKWLSKALQTALTSHNTIHHLANTYEDIRQRVVPRRDIEDNRGGAGLIASVAGRKRSGRRETRRTISVVRGRQCASNELLYAERARTLLSQLLTVTGAPQIHQAVGPEAGAVAAHQ